MQYRFIQFSVLVRFIQYLTDTERYILKLILLVKLVKYQLNIGSHFLP